MALLRIDNLQYLDFPVVNLHLAAGESISVSGPSGVGKSLLLRAIADLDPHSGHIFFDNIECASMSPAEWRGKVGLLLPESQWWEDIVAHHFPGNILEDPAASIWTERLNLNKSIFSSQTSRLSSGERQRLALIRLLLNSPQVLLLDEPTASLDTINTEQVENLIAEYLNERNASAIWVSHNTEQAQRVASRHFCFKGKVLLPCEPVLEGK